MTKAERSYEAMVGERRWGFAVFNLVLWWVGMVPMVVRVFEDGWTAGGLALVILYAVLLAHVVYGFTLAATGWWLLRRGGDPLRINASIPPDAATDKLPPTAVVIPIYNEDVGRVFQGVGAMYESVQTTIGGGGFHFFILSDTTDLNTWLAEEKAWFELCQKVRGFGHIFYRKRRTQLHNKSGNLADFCRRWGADYRYMIVLDADSVMTGAALVRLVRLMEANPRAGIIQTNSKLVLGRSLFQRINQFASHVYGPLFVAGANFWQLDNANYYGHNAIIRLRPFMKFCALPELPKVGALGTRILSHDTVEAALMRRAGYAVWSAYDLEGSYEESPPHLLASLQRDRRWCHGNLQHLWLLAAPGMTRASRVNLLLGIMAYVGSPLWLAFLVLSPLLFLGGNNSPVNGSMFLYVLALLLMPKWLGALHLMASTAQFQTIGSRLRVFRDVAVETLGSMILAPILMLFYTQFVWAAFFGAGMAWGRQKRADEAGPTWSDLVAAHLGHVLLAIIVGALVAGLVPALLPWMLLILAGPIMAIPLSRLLASTSLGALSRRQGWWLIPEETDPPAELRQVVEPFESSPHRFPAIMAQSPDFGLLQTVLDPYLNTIHVSLLRKRVTVSGRARDYQASLGQRLLSDGPRSLTPGEKKALLWDAETLMEVHQKMWADHALEVNVWWQAAFRIYNQFNRQKNDRATGRPADETGLATVSE